MAAQREAARKEIEKIKVAQHEAALKEIENIKKAKKEVAQKEAAQKETTQNEIEKIKMGSTKVTDDSKKIQQNQKLKCQNHTINSKRFLSTYWLRFSLYLLKALINKYEFYRPNVFPILPLARIAYMTAVYHFSSEYYHSIEIWFLVFRCKI